jgi:cytochrome c oxidase subunit 2
MNTPPALLRLVTTLGLMLGATATAQPDGLVEQGRALYTQHGCYGCHTLRGTGTPIAPDLSRAGARFTEPELTLRLRDPAIHRPGAHMPRLDLTDQDIRALVAYLATLR